MLAASDGYPASYEKGFEIKLPESMSTYIAGSSSKMAKQVTSGGRVLGVVETAPTSMKQWIKPMRS